MAKKLEVILDDAEFAALDALARGHGITVAEWVRSALADARRRDPKAIFPDKLRALHDAIRQECPSADIDQMLLEIERGYLPSET